ncbi:leucine-rich repeat-containing protein [Elysia marginata]|uniref:Leucine-rich repeat-containing protein n=1 Tax=Elysia marginata TaxID=1093978 RepID=A0AAV4ESR0_9GAST|nr:leucine-rich repeat-containing protein [Elysia marginata]
MLDTRGLNLNIFRSCANLTELTLTLRECETLPNHALNLSNLLTLRLIGYKVTDMPSTFLTGLGKLNYLSLDLPELPQISFPLTNLWQNLERLEIKHVKSLPPIPTLPSLTSLHLEGIFSLGEHLFHNIPYLKNLTVTGCKLSKIKLPWVSSWTAVSELNLSHNRLSAGTIPSLSQLASLDNLNLSNNKIQDRLPNLPSTVRLLVLTNNDIEVLDKNFFSGLPKLATLMLNDNSIHTIKAGTFTEMSELEHVSLLDNNLSGFEPWSLSGLSSLVTLDLSGNRFSQIPPALKNSPLSELVLKDNLIKDINDDDTVLCTMPSLTQVLLENNPIECNCIPSCLRVLGANIVGFCNAAAGKMPLADMQNCTFLVEQSTSSPQEDRKHHESTHKTELSSLVESDSSDHEVTASTIGLLKVDTTADEVENVTDSDGKVDLSTHSDGDVLTKVNPTTYVVPVQSIGNTSDSDGKVDPSTQSKSNSDGLSELDTTTDAVQNTGNTSDSDGEVDPSTQSKSNSDGLSELYTTTDVVNKMENVSDSGSKVKPRAKLDPGRNQTTDVVQTTGTGNMLESDDKALSEIKFDPHTDSNKHGLSKVNATDAVQSAGNVSLSDDLSKSKMDNVSESTLHLHTEPPQLTESDNHTASTTEYSPSNRLDIVPSSSPFLTGLEDDVDFLGKERASEFSVPEESDTEEDGQTAIIVTSVVIAIVISTAFLGATYVFLRKRNQGTYDTDQQESNPQAMPMKESGVA